MTVVNDLIYDLGTNNGDDAAYYLACGFRVLAIDADPGLVAQVKERFKAEIEAKRIIVLNVAIAAKTDKAEFWINDLHPELNSFDRGLVTRSDDAHHSIWIGCRRLDDILSEYGIPYYLKIDIEGHDIVCCEQLSSSIKPKYISVEMSQIELLLKLRDLGYDRFKLINQNNYQPIRSEDPAFYEGALIRIFNIANYQKQDRKLSLRLLRKGAAKVLAMASALGLWGELENFRSRIVPEWKFNLGSAGSFGEDLPGEWYTWQEIAYTWHRELKIHERKGLTFRTPNTEAVQGFWCDLHATFSSEKN
jgi:FkbM family methyltransferase